MQRIENCDKSDKTGANQTKHNFSRMMTSTCLVWRVSHSPSSAKKGKSGEREGKKAWVTCNETHTHFISVLEKNAFLIIFHLYLFWRNRTVNEYYFLIMYRQVQYLKVFKRETIIKKSNFQTKWRLTRNFARSWSWPRSKSKIVQSPTGSATVLATPSRTVGFPFFWFVEKVKRIEIQNRIKVQRQETPLAPYQDWYLNHSYQSRVDSQKWWCCTFFQCAFDSIKQGCTTDL